MRAKIFLVLAVLALIILPSCGPKAEPMNYPVTKTVDQVDDYFGTKVPDPFRWLENDTAKEVGQWVIDQNKVTFGFLEKIPFRNKIKTRLEEVYNYTRVTSPMKVGEYYLYYKNNGLQNQSVIYSKKGINGPEEVFIDPNKLSDKGKSKQQSVKTVIGV